MLNREPVESSNRKPECKRVTIRKITSALPRQCPIHAKSEDRFESLISSDKPGARGADYILQTDVLPISHTGVEMD
jgi:hypothetical protein